MPLKLHCPLRSELIESRPVEKDTVTALRSALRQKCCTSAAAIPKLKCPPMSKCKQRKGREIRKEIGLVIVSDGHKVYFEDHLTLSQDQFPFAFPSITMDRWTGGQTDGRRDRQTDRLSSSAKRKKS